MYERWSQNGSVWSAAASKVCWILSKSLTSNNPLEIGFQVHADQLNHIRKGCLAWHHQDIASDGSWIEGSHKGWNSLQHTQPSGIEVYAALAHDFVLWQNIRVFLSHPKKRQLTSTDLLVSFASGSHHINLIKHLTVSFNLLLDGQPQKVKDKLSRLPIFENVQTDEEFGLVRSAHTELFGGLFIKEELEETNDQVLQELSRCMEDAQLSDDPDLYCLPEQPESASLNGAKNEALMVHSGLKRKLSSTALEISPELQDGNSQEPSRKKLNITHSLPGPLLLPVDCLNETVLDESVSTDLYFWFQVAINWLHYRQILTVCYLRKLIWLQRRHHRDFSSLKHLWSLQAIKYHQLQIHFWHFPHHFPFPNCPNSRALSSFSQLVLPLTLGAWLLREA